MEVKSNYLNYQFVYVILNEETYNVKIGITNNIERRIAELANASGCKLTVVYMTPRLKDAQVLEYEAHEHFRTNRLIGEWFKISPTKAKEFLENNLSRHHVVYDITDNKNLPVEILFNFAEFAKKTFEREFQKEHKKAMVEKDRKLFGFYDYEEHVLLEPMSRFKRIGKNIYARKATNEKYFIVYKDKQWIARKLKE